MRAAVLVWAALSSAGLAGCGEAEPEAAVAPAIEPTSEPAWNPQVRRPPWVFVFEKIGERCVVLRIDEGERIVRGEEFACPIDMQVGERLRLAGSVCIRESKDQARVLPVTCPDVLTNAEKDFLEEKQRKGELTPAAASTPPPR